MRSTSDSPRDGCHLVPAALSASGGGPIFGRMSDPDLPTLQRAVGEWADATFPHATPSTIVAHLRDEVLDELDPHADPSEAADCFLLLLHFAHKRGFDLAAAALDKLDVNRARSWSPPDERGVSTHLADV